VASDAPRPLLAVSNIEVIYDHVILVLKGVSLAVPEGGIVALLGANGAGKSTTLKAISGLLRTERGEVTSHVGEMIASVKLVRAYVAEAFELERFRELAERYRKRVLRVMREQGLIQRRRAVARRSHKGRVSMERMQRLLDRWLPPARVCHPYPLRRLGVIT